jgi:hypothetical protein
MQPLTAPRALRTRYPRGRNMNPSAIQPTRIVVVLKLPQYKVPLLIVRARNILQRVTESPWFPSPSPSLATLQAAIDVLADAQAKTLSRAKETVAVRNVMRRNLVALLEQLRSYVEAIASVNPDHAAEIAESAGMYLKGLRGRAGLVFTVKQLRSGEVLVSAPRAARYAAYEFQYSLDGGATWLGLAQQITTKTTATVPGLKPGSTVYFRYRATVKGVTGNWSDPISFIVG